MSIRKYENLLVGVIMGSFLSTDKKTALIEVVRQEAAKGDWIFPDEKKPDVFQKVLICREKEPGRLMVEQGFLDVGDWWKVYGTRVKKIYAWMPLPEPPDKEKT